MRRRVAWIGLIALAACGGGGSGDDSDSGPGGDSDATSASPDAAPTGPIRITDSKIFVQRGTSTMITFSLDAEGPGSCLSEIVAGCEVQDCQSGTTPVRASAGTVTLTTPLGEAVHTPDAGNLYTGPASDWEPGDDVTLTVAGSDQIAAFEVTVPGPGAVTAVTAPSLGGTPVPRDQPLAFEWEGADAAVTGVVSCTSPEGHIQQVRCRFPTGVMGSAMPAEALGRLPQCSDGNIYLLTEERVITGPAGLAVRFGARGPIHAGTAVVE